MRLLIIGSGDSIFLVNYVKALKKQCDDIEVTVYSPHPNRGENKKLPYDNVVFDSFYASQWNRVPFISFMILPFVQRFHFQKFIKDKNFDIIHIHRVLPAWVIGPGVFKRHCKKLYLSFWGGEIDREVLLRSHNRYLSHLECLVNDAYKVVGAMNDERIVQRFPCIKSKAAYGVFGSSIIDELCKNNINKTDVKKAFCIPEGKISVLLGYSGKSIHQHCRIVEELISREEFAKYRDRIHLLASMTRGASSVYIDEVENKMKASGCSYTIIKNCYQADKDVARFRVATDILFQLSTSDYLSASVKENLCAGVIMISGSWLPYQILKNDNFYFEEVGDISSGIDMLFEILDNFETYSTNAQANKSLCDKKYTWDACIQDYVKAYNS